LYYEIIRKNNPIPMFQIFREYGADLHAHTNNHSLLSRVLLTQSRIPECDDLISYLVNSGVTLNDMDFTSKHSFFKSLTKNPEIVRTFLSNNCSDHIRRELLTSAAINSHIESMEILVEAGVDVNSIDRYGFTPLYYALNSHDQSMIADGYTRNQNAIELLIRSGANTSSIENEPNLMSDLNTILTASNNRDPHERFLSSILSQDYESVKQILFQNPKLANCRFNSNPFTNRCALGVAISINDLNMVKILIDHGADITTPVQINPDFSPLGFYCVKQDVIQSEIMEYLASKGATVYNHEIDNNVILRSLVKNPSVIDAMIHQGNCNDDLKYALLKRAAENNNIEAMRMLISSGFDINRKDSDGNNALHHALQSRSQNFEAISLLLQNNADTNALNNSGHTPVNANDTTISKYAAYLSSHDDMVRRANQRNISSRELLATAVPDNDIGSNHIMRNNGINRR
jgi:ankyrin repeat protein